MVTVLTRYVSNQIASRLRAHSCKAVRCSRQKGSVDLYAHIKFRWLREIATFNYWEGSEASCFQKQDWCTTWVLLSDQCKGMDDYKDLPRVVAGVGLVTQG